jgi:N-acetyl-gamma-glutamyl-phosphate reductase
MGLKVAVYGGSGYTGGELLRLLSGHPEVGAVEVSSRQHAGSVVGDVYPQLAVRERFVEAGEIDASALDVAFVAYPHGERRDGGGFARGWYEACRGPLG